MRRDGPFLSTTEAAGLAGVTPSTMKRWADEGLLACGRTAGGHRRFQLADIERFLTAREVQAQGFTPIAERWLALLERSDPYPLLGALFEARGRLGGWWRVADELGEGLTALGERWASGAITIVEEHLASDRLHRALRQICGGLVASPEAPVCVLATAEGDDHTLGLSLAELCLRARHWRALWLGRATPTREVARTLELPGVSMVALSASLASHDRRSLGAEARFLGAACLRRGVPLVLGGRAPWPRGVKGATRVDGFCAFDDLLAQLEKQLR